MPKTAFMFTTYETGIQGTLNPIPGGIAGRSSAIDAADAAKQAQVDAASGGSE